MVNNFRFGVMRDLSLSQTFGDLWQNYDGAATSSDEQEWARIAFIPLGDSMNWAEAGTGAPTCGTGKGFALTSRGTCTACDTTATGATCVTDNVVSWDEQNFQGLLK